MEQTTLLHHQYLIDIQGRRWGSPILTGAAFDFRSDVVTTPSISMLRAITRTTLNDDVYGEDSTTTEFEQEIANLCRHEAAAFVMSGTMANQLALRTLLWQPPHAILADADAHIVHWEAGGIAHLSGAMLQAVQPSNGLYLTLEDIQKHAILSDDVHKCPTRVVSIENTSNGTIVPLEEMQRLKAWAEKAGIQVHIDGARLWEAIAAGSGTLAEYAQCSDLLTLDFSKGLGAPMGAMVVGSTESIKRLRRIRKSIGGGMRQSGVLVAAARQALLENFGVSQQDERGILKKSHSLAKTVEKLWAERGGKFLRLVETNIVWLDLDASGVTEKEWVEAGQQHGLKLMGKRVVTHYQICDDAMSALQSVIEEVFAE
ncbi:hypothetical protein P3342_007280 [Pyrenophora teres f. teres]|uniref:Beta elim lyase multi-domain protein n=1 Tax=Pyrenophora teres f. teres TaxID=97479 RepID=A0A6S6W1Q0_9PLEO|nr:hypothetical protein HRS9139_05747 [Pyrenophora teres f. teres]KAE8840302.1 hypothetical protein PTNB85_03701 [Pyrenophora teres f. teres]KAE8863801.1 hypothetical protein PTNB29_03765 [Pyrenophora teres f. teres]KAK1914034.1 hypothetical protein P3342_007280 [Pyrenophora teres f. teres]CAE7034252.1 Beta elim lyase multi-domain protein [Pyrenophora teres f. teres]